MKLIFALYRFFNVIYRFIMRFYYTNKIKITCKSYGNNLRVNKNSSIGKNVILGNNCNFNGCKITGYGDVIIGNNFHSGEDILMITSIHNYDHGNRIPYDDTNINKNIIIEDNVWIGSRVIILGGCTIGEGAIIQAGAVVVKDIPKYGIAGGNPAKVFKYRDIKHYEEFKNKRLFH